MGSLLVVGTKWAQKILEKGRFYRAFEHGQGIQNPVVISTTFMGVFKIWNQLLLANIQDSVHFVLRRRA